MIKSSVDAIYAYRFLRLLVINLKNTTAYKLGLIDEKGNIIKKPITPKEKNELTIFVRMVLYIRRNLERFRISPKVLIGVASIDILMKKLNENFRIPLGKQLAIIDEAYKVLHSNRVDEATTLSNIARYDVPINSGNTDIYNLEVPEKEREIMKKELEEILKEINK